MQTGTFTGELSRQRVSQLQAEVQAHRVAERAVQSRRSQRQLSRRAAHVYRKALTAVALGLLLVIGVATAALAMPQPPEPGHVAGGSAGTATHVSTLVGPSSGGNAWVAVTAFVVVTALLASLATRSRRAEA